MLARAVAVKVTGEPNAPATDADSDWVPAAVPSVQFTPALPSTPVVAVAPDVVPFAAAAVNVMVRPLIGASDVASRKMTTMGFVSVCPTVAVWLTPAMASSRPLDTVNGTDSVVTPPAEKARRRSVPAPLMTRLVNRATPLVGTTGVVLFIVAPDELATSVTLTGVVICVASSSPGASTRTWIGVNAVPTLPLVGCPISKLLTQFSSTPRT